jgi:hypothetical protein
VKQCEIVDVAQVAPGTQHLGAEMVKPVEVKVGEELAGQIA